MHHGGAGPWWLNVLIASEKWGTPPWEIAGGGRVRWFLRWQAFEQQRSLAARPDAAPSPWADEGWD